MAENDAERRSNFIREIIDADLEAGTHGGRVATRFPPEPNGYLHIGHAKSICLNFGLALDYKGTCNLRFDDTNPVKEDQEYVDSIAADVKWLGFDWPGEPKFASDYFEQMYDYAVALIHKGLAYVDSLDVETLREYRGRFDEPGRDSPYRTRSVEENLDLFARMRAVRAERSPFGLRLRNRACVTKGTCDARGRRAAKVSDVAARRVSRRGTSGGCALAIFARRVV